MIDRRRLDELLLEILPPGTPQEHHDLVAVLLSAACADIARQLGSTDAEISGLERWVGFYGRDADSTETVAADARVRAMLGLSADAPSGRVWEVWKNCIHPDDIERIDD